MPLIQIDNPGIEGIITDIDPQELPNNAFSAGQNWRFNNKSASKVQGHSQSFGALSVDPYWLMPAATDTNDFWIYAGLIKVYVTDGTTHFNLTRQKATAITAASIANPTVITAAAHGITDGDTVVITGDSTSTPTINGTHVATVLTANTFTIPVNVTGAGTNGTVTADTDYAATADKSWNGGIIGAIPVINNGIDDPQMWSPINTGTRLVSLTWDGSDTWATKDWQASVIRVFREYLIALDVTKAGTENHRLVAWSTSAVPNTVPSTWDKDTLSEDAGEVELAQTNGNVIDGLALGDMFVIYKDDSIWAMRFTGGVNIFRFDLLFSNVGLLSRRCVKEFDGKHFILSAGDVAVHDGTTIKSVIDEKRRNELFANIEGDNFRRCYVVPNYINQEMWVCYPSSGAALPDKAMIWNWTNGSWGDRDLPSAPHIGFGLVNDSNESLVWDDDTDVWDNDTTTWNSKNFNPSDRRMLMAAGSKLLLVDDTTQFDGVDFTGFVQRTGMHFDDPERIKHVSEFWLRATGSGTVTVTLGYQSSPNSAITWNAPQSYTIGTDSKVNVRTSGRYIAYKIESTSNDTVNILGIGFNIKFTGRR